MLSLCCLTLIGMHAQEISSKGRVVDASDGSVIKDAQLEVRAYRTSPTVFKVDADGKYLFKGLKNKLYTVTVTAPGYEARQFEWNGQTKDLSILKLNSLSSSNFRNMAMNDLFIEDLATIGDNEVQETSPLLMASRDPYTNAASYVFSPMRFRTRGYDSPYQMQYLNGLQMNDLNTGYSVWSLWGGLNDAVRNQVVTLNSEPGEYSFGSIGGATNIDTRASAIRSGSKFSYSMSNRTYTNRLMFTHSSGMLPSGWAYAFSVSGRFGSGNMSYVRGQFYQAFGLYAGIEKKIRNHDLSFTAIMSPTSRGVASGSTQEVYDLVGSHYYNPNIGRQHGDWRNARVRNNFEPILTLNYNWNITPDTKLSLNTGYRFGYNAYSALNWSNAQDPRPDYYRYLPSYYTYLSETPDYAIADYVAMLWQTDPNVRYIDWDRIYNINRENEQTIYGEDGKVLAQGKKSEYILEDRRTDQRQWNASAIINSQLNDVFRVDGGVDVRINRTANFNKLKDLLGGDYYYDIDKFAENEFGDPASSQLDLNHPNHIAKEGDKIGHNYYSHIQTAKAWGVLSMNFHNKVQAYVGGEAAFTKMYREGLQMRGLFPNNSYGNSDKLNFTDWGVKVGATYQINGHHYLSVHGTVMTQAPFFRNVFVSPRTRNSHVDDPKSEMIYSADADYQIRMPFLKGRISGFYTRINDRMRNMSFYDDGYRTFSNYVLSGIDEQNVGVEVGLEAKLSPSWTANGVFTYGHYTYVSNPKFVQTVDNSDKVQARERVYWKGFNTAGTPQTAASIGLQYNSPRYWFAGVNANYFGRSFIDMNPLRRTDLAREQLAPEYVSRERFNDGFTVDAFAGYSYRIKSGMYLRINLSASNILNNKNLKSGGFEQLRIRRSKDGNTMTRPFDSKYFYMYGTTFFLNCSLQF